MHPLSTYKHILWKMMSKRLGVGAVDRVQRSSAGLKRLGIDIFFYISIYNSLDCYTYLSHYLKHGFEYILNKRYFQENDSRIFQIVYQ